ncbi:HAMP domain-containing protein [Sphingomonas sp. PL-96]|uniref:sensor histidine kinase n=1 Tax=Sphingomonas sp. PL-96 TaxID=2887201 RepID=UPI001E493D84|nr:ATP-binding protein [Sphingomonas sp. PL-96]MCC2975788.1 HAMP domain-containing protein [Sphingomonas sp. PL-96]
MNRLWPRSLSGQIALLVAIALFVAQAINFAMLLRERSAVRFAQVTVPAVTRMVDAAERLRGDRIADRQAPRGVRSRAVRLRLTNPLEHKGTSDPEFETAVRNAFSDAGLEVRRIETEIQLVNPRDPALRRLDRGYAERLRRYGATLKVAAEIPGQGWLVLETPWPNTQQGLVWQLIAQTLILYGFVLLPVLWIGSRISKPLRALTQAAHAYRPGSAANIVEESGPGDVRAVIAAFNGMSVRVGGMLEEKDRMLGAIGHDLRTPLAALRVRIESVEDDADRARMAETIDEMNRTLEDILSLARLGRPSEPETQVDLAALVDAVVEDFRDLGADVSFEETERQRLRLRPTLMRRAIRNLIENAVKYAGGAEVRLVADPTRVRIEVADRGPGIPPEQIAAVFQPFTRLETSRNRETGGIGLGLALAQAIVGDAGGEIALANREGGGLLATITLPRG